MHESAGPASGRPAVALSTRPDIVVQDYLDALLRDVLPEPESAPDAHELAAADAVAAEQGAPDDIDAAPDQLQSEELCDGDCTAVGTSPHSVTVDAEQEQALVILQAADMTIESSRSRTRPGWSQSTFAVLLFDVDGLNLAAPLHDLGGICPLEDRLQPVVGQADWFMGLLRWNDRNIRVIDTARYVMPERMSGNEHRSAYRSVIILGDSHWGLAVDNADQSLSLEPPDIKWRSKMGKRPWLAGTVLDNLRALLDIEVLLSILNACDPGIEDTTKH